VSEIATGDSRFRPYDFGYNPIPSPDSDLSDDSDDEGRVTHHIHITTIEINILSSDHVFLDSSPCS